MHTPLILCLIGHKLTHVGVPNLGGTGAKWRKAGRLAMSDDDAASAVLKCDTSDVTKPAVVTGDVPARSAAVADHSVDSRTAPSVRLSYGIRRRPERDSLWLHSVC